MNEEAVPEGIHAYIYSPTIQQTQLVIEVNSPNLPSAWETLILKLAAAYKGEDFLLEGNQKNLFYKLLSDIPSPQADISIDAKPLLDQRNIVVPSEYERIK